MPALPVVGVIACRRSVEGEDAQIVKERYLDAVRRNADALPLIVPNNLDADDVINLLPRMDALLLTGSNSNIAPSRYGSTEAQRGMLDATRDNSTARLIEAAVERGTPLFGICRGLQEINVAFGGSLADERDIGTHRKRGLRSDSNHSLFRKRKCPACQGAWRTSLSLHPPKSALLRTLGLPSRTPREPRKLPWLDTPTPHLH